MAPKCHWRSRKIQQSMGVRTLNGSMGVRTLNWTLTLNNRSYIYAIQFYVAFITDS